MRSLTHLPRFRSEIPSATRLWGRNLWSENKSHRVPMIDPLRLAGVEVLVDGRPVGKRGPWNALASVNRPNGRFGSQAGLQGATIAACSPGEALACRENAHRGALQTRGFRFSADAGRAPAAETSRARGAGVNRKRQIRRVAKLNAPAAHHKLGTVGGVMAQ